MTQFDLNRLMAARATALTKMFSTLSIPLECVYTSWEDAMRAHRSCLGPNIKDVGLVFRNAKGKEGGAETFGFKVRSNNFNEIIVEIDSRVFNIPISKKDGSEPRMVTLAYALEHAGELFSHCGLPADCNLYHPELDNGKVKLRIDLIFAPKGERAPDEEFAAKEFSLTTYSYQARDGNARNIDLFSHPQGTSCRDDGSAKGMLRPQCVVPSPANPGAEMLADFWIEAEDTGKAVQDMHTESVAESQAAAARGKGTAVRTMEGWDRLPNLFHFIQVPRVQDRPPPVRPPLADPYFDSGMSAKKQKSPPPSEWEMVEGEMGESEDDDVMPHYCSLSSGPISDAPVEEAMYRGASSGPQYRDFSDNHRMRSLSSAPRASSKLTSARISRGSYAGESPGVRSKAVVRAPEPITITSTIVVMCDGDEPPEVDQVKHLWETVKRMQRTAGEAKHLMDKSAGLTTGAPLTKADLKDIEDKHAVHGPTPPQMPVAPLVGMVVGA
jgi:hypothetical protein